MTINNTLIDDGLYIVKETIQKISNLSLSAYSGQGNTVKITTPSGYKFIAHIYGYAFGSGQIIGHLEDSFNETSPNVYTYNARNSDYSSSHISCIVLTLYKKIT